MIKTKLINKDIEKYAEECGTWIYGTSLVPDNWLNQIKTYLNFDLKDKVYKLRSMTMCMLIQLAVARIDDLISKEELKVIEEKIEKRIAYYYKLIDWNDNKDTIKLEKKLPEGLSKLISLSRETIKKYKITIQQDWIEVIKKTIDDSGKLDETIEKYITGKIKLFEEQNFRKILEPELDF